MKVCPVCSESFADDLKFCDLDGTRLTRQLDGSVPPQGHNKLWSMLGIGLLVGALILSAVSVFLIPKSRVSLPSSSESQASTSSSKPSNDTGGNTIASATAEQPEIVVTEGPVPDARKKDKLKSLTEENSNSPALNPKAAAQSGEDTEKTPQPVAEPPAPKKSESAPAVKPVSETREPDPATKTATASPDPKKDPRHATTNSSKDSDKKKTDDKDKKKGGFFKVFKKIFGKD
jgi:hypothetical protein